MAALLLLGGDIGPNPGWTYPVLNSPGLTIVHLNIRSLPKHFDEFKIFMNDNPFDVMCLSETWLNSTWSDAELYIDGYNIIRTDRNDSQRGGGTAIYYISMELDDRLSISTYIQAHISKSKIETYV